MRPVMGSSSLFRNMGFLLSYQRWGRPPNPDNFRIVYDYGIALSSLPYPSPLPLSPSLYPPYLPPPTPPPPSLPASFSLPPPPPLPLPPPFPSLPSLLPLSLPSPLSSLSLLPLSPPSNASVTHKAGPKLACSSLSVSRCGETPSTWGLKALVRAREDGMLQEGTIGDRILEIVRASHTLGTGYPHDSDLSY